jgi:c-di-GMP-binding flagellar brake protein YcgR
MASNPTLVAVAMVMVAMLVGAFVIEILRRRIDKRRRVEAEWRGVETIIRERDLGEPESKRLHDLLDRHAPEDPYRAVTVRAAFNECVEAEMDRVQEEQPDHLAETGSTLRLIREELGLDFIPVGQRINSTRELYLQQLIYVAFVEKPAASDWREMHVDAVDEAYFFLSPPKGEALPAARAGEVIQCRMWREDDARYRYSTTVAGVRTSPPELVLAHTKDLRRTQARAHFRVRYEQAAEIEVLPGRVEERYQDLDERDVITRVRGRVTSLSGGGFAVMTNTPIPKQVVLRTRLELDVDAGPVQVAASLVGSTPLYGGRYLLRGTFVNIDDDTRERITHYVFRKQQGRQAAAEMADVRD